MREYKPKGDVQKKSYYRDRFYVAPRVKIEEVLEDSIFFEDVSKLKDNFKIEEAYIELGQLVCYIQKDDLSSVLKFVSTTLNYEILSELSAIDYLHTRGEFELFYQVLNLNKRARARIKTKIKESESIESVESIYKSANWAEREMYDMFGIKINNHPYMKRILMPDDWEGHPLRKSYPLQGDEFAQWYEVDKIFGKESRSVIGPENRDAAMIDRYDTTRFSRLGHEVKYGDSIELGEPDTGIKYQEDKRPFLIDKLDFDKSKELKQRK